MFKNEKVTSAYCSEQRTTIKFYVDLGKNTDKNDRGNRKNINMVRDHISTSDTSDCLIELAIVPFGNTMNVIYHSRVNQELP